MGTDPSRRAKRSGHADCSEQTSVGGRLLAYVLAEMLWHYIKGDCHSDKAFMRYADRMRTWHRTMAPGCRWKLIPRTPQMLLRQSGYLEFERKLWETLTFCPQKKCGRAQSLDGFTDVGNTCKFCGAALKHAKTGRYLSQTAYMRMANLLTWIANDADLLPAHVQFHKTVEDSLLGDSDDVHNLFQADGVRAQLRNGGADAERMIVRNPLCLKVVLMTDDKQMLQQHGCKGPVTLGASMLALKSVPAGLRSNSMNAKFLTRIQTTKAAVNMQSQYEKLVRDLHPYKPYKVSAWTPFTARLPPPDSCPLPPVAL